MVHAAVGFARHAEPAAGAGLHRVDRPRRDEHGHRGGAGHHQPHARCCCCPATTSPPGRPARCSRSSSDPRSFDVSVNDAFKPVSRYWDRINRPEQLSSALLAAMRVLTDPAEDRRGRPWPCRRTCRPRHTTGPRSCSPSGSGTWPGRCPEPAALHRAAAVLKSARRPLIVAGGGVIYADASAALRRAGRGHRHPGGRDPGRQGGAGLGSPAVGGRRRRDRLAAANALAADADVVLGVGTRYSDFTTASRTVFADPQVRFVNLNVTGFDAGKHAAIGAGRRRPGRSRGAQGRAGRLPRPPRRTRPGPASCPPPGSSRWTGPTTWATSRSPGRPR